MCADIYIYISRNSLPLPLPLPPRPSPSLKIFNLWRRDGFIVCSKSPGVLSVSMGYTICVIYIAISCIKKAKEYKSHDSSNSCTNAA